MPAVWVGMSWTVVGTKGESNGIPLTGIIPTVMLAGQAIIGISLSVTVTAKEQLAVLPAASVTIKVLVVVPMGNVAAEASPAVWVMKAPAQLSEEVTE